MPWAGDWVGQVIRVCGERGCAKRHHARGYCKTHYARWLRHGDPAVTLRRDMYERARADLAEMATWDDDDD